MTLLTHQGEEPAFPYAGQPMHILAGHGSLPESRSQRLPGNTARGHRLARVYLHGEWRILVVTNMADGETGAPGV